MNETERSGANGLELADRQVMHAREGVACSRVNHVTNVRLTDKKSQLRSQRVSVPIASAATDELVTLTA